MYLEIAFSGPVPRDSNGQLLLRVPQSSVADALRLCRGCRRLQVRDTVLRASSSSASALARCNGAARAAVLTRGSPLTSGVQPQVARAGAEVAAHGNLGKGGARSAAGPPSAGSQGSGGLQPRHPPPSLPPEARQMPRLGVGAWPNWGVARGRACRGILFAPATALVAHPFHRGGRPTSPSMGPRWSVHAASRAPLSVAWRMAPGHPRQRVGDGFQPRRARRPAQHATRACARGLRPRGARPPPWGSHRRAGQGAPPW